MGLDFRLNRRNFLVSSAVASGGFALGFANPARAQGAAAAATPEVNAWVVIKPDNSVIVRIGRVEMGQGTLTGLAQLVAEELDADWANVTTEYPSPSDNVTRERVWGPFMTAGSQGVRGSQQYMREGGAAARQMLLQAAAERWGVDVASLATSKGTVTGGPDGAVLTYGELAEAAAALTPPESVTLKDPASWTIAGQDLLRLDTVGKTDGSQIFGVDVKLEGMLCAAVRSCRVMGGKIASYDATEAEGMPGVKKVVQIDEATIGVVADTWWRANKAVDAVQIEWDLGENGTFGMEVLHAMLDDGLGAEEAFVGNENGDAKAALADAATVVEADYHFPWQHHATMEPMNVTCMYTPEKVTVWVPTQNAESELALYMEATGLSHEQIEINRINLGGGFGRRGASSLEYNLQALALAKEFPGTPIKLIWTREEDHTHGTYHPATKARLKGALDADGNLTALHMRISGQSIFAGLMPFALQESGMDPMVFQGLNPDGTEGAIGYSVPNLLIDHAMRNPPIRPGFWRGVNNNQNSFYLESFIDELAHAAGKDPYEFRRTLMAEHPKHLAVLDAVAEGINWSAGAPEGHGYGICQHMGYGSYVAAAADVSVDEAGKLTIHKIVAATNPGHVVNPQQVRAQIEGSFAMGLSAALFSQITMKGGEVQETNFHSYPVVMMRDMPEVESLLVPTHDFWGGVGEPTIFAATPAVINAIFAATGKRVRTLPLSQTDLRG